MLKIQQMSDKFAEEVDMEWSDHPFIPNYIVRNSVTICGRS